MLRPTTFQLRISRRGLTQIRGFCGAPGRKFASIAPRYRGSQMPSRHPLRRPISGSDWARPAAAESPSDVFNYREIRVCARVGAAFRADGHPGRGLQTRHFSACGSTTPSIVQRPQAMRPRPPPPGTGRLYPRPSWCHQEFKTFYDGSVSPFVEYVLHRAGWQGGSAVGRRHGDLDRPTGHVYTTKPGASLFFPMLATPTGELVIPEHSGPPRHQPRTDDADPPTHPHPRPRLPHRPRTPTQRRPHRPQTTPTRRTTRQRRRAAAVLTASRIDLSRNLFHRRDIPRRSQPAV